jgi:hypothetical protein
MRGSGWGVVGGGVGEVSIGQWWVIWDQLGG